MPNKDSPAGLSPAEAGERKRIEQTIGSIGGKPRLKGKILNIAFVLAVCGAFAASLLTSGISRIASIDLGLVLLSLKFAYHLHTEAKVNHAQFWILSTIEDRLLDIIRELRQVRREFRDFSPPKQDTLATETAMKEAPNPRPED